MPEAPELTFSPTEKRLLEVFSDGEAHSKRELFQRCIDDQYAQDSTLLAAISNLRKKLILRGEAVICEARHRKGFYRHVKLIGGAAGSLTSNALTDE